MMMKLALLAPVATAFVAPRGAPSGSTAVKAEEMDLDLEQMFEVFDAADSGSVALLSAELKGPSDALMKFEGASAPLGVWDPAGFSKLGDERTLAWFRASELKHGRIAMAATTGWIINEAGVTFSGNLASGLPFASVGKGVAAWDHVPAAGKLQILATIAALELAGETAKPHYINGGKPGAIPGPFGLRLWDPLKTITNMDEATKAEKRLSELNNGRLAMIGVASFAAASFIDGSVPALPDSW